MPMTEFAGNTNITNLVREMCDEMSTKRDVQAITLNMVEKAYAGKQSPGKSCRCGCGGNYYKGADAMVLHVLRMVQAYAAVGLAEDFGSGIDVVVKDKGKTERVFTIYLKQ